MIDLYYNIFKLFLHKDLYDQYSRYVNSLDNYPELQRIFNIFPKLHSGGVGGDKNVEDLEAIFYAEFPNADSQQYKPLFERITAAQAKPESVRQYLDSAQRISAGNELASLYLRFASQQISAEQLSEEAAPLQLLVQTGVDFSKDDPCQFVTHDLEELYNQRRKTAGLRWRLQSLNQSLGSLREGDFGFLFARPECGKTTFLASEMTFMAEQTERAIVWFNNEEQGSKVQTRIYQAAFGIQLETLYGNRQKWKESFSKYEGLQVKDEANLSRKSCEQIIQIVKPRLIIFDQIDKVKGFTGDRPDLEHKERYQWAREMAKVYQSSVIGVCQAGSTGEYKKYLDMNDIDGSKTAKQGEADWILGIGQTDEEGKEELRFMSLCKNKLDGDADTKPEYRHRKWITRIVPEVARYKDV